jgi:hypothetical protein
VGASAKTIVDTYDREAEARSLASHVEAAVAQVALVEAAQSARAVMDLKLMELCGRQVPGDTHRNLSIGPNYSDRTFKHILAPIWLLSYTYGRRTFQVIANGYTGVLAGQYPKSAWKIAGAVLVVVAIAIILLVLAQQQQ